MNGDEELEELLGAALRADYGDDCSLEQAYWRGHGEGHALGHQAGLLAAGEPWVALLFAVAGTLLGWGACFLIYGR